MTGFGKGYFCGSNAVWIYTGFSANERLPKTANTVRYFHAQIEIMMDKSYLQRDKMAINLEHNGKQ